jgi:hypothetical protein
VLLAILPARHPAFCKAINDAADLLLVSHPAILVSSTRSINMDSSNAYVQKAALKKIAQFRLIDFAGSILPIAIDFAGSILPIG